MKILAINGSPRGSRSQTLRLVQAVLEGARSAGADGELVDVAKLQIEYCTGCLTCCERGECVRDDDFAALYQQMLESDGIVFGSPNYIDSVTAQIKTMLDRMADAIHCQVFTGKYGCAVATAGGSGADEVVAYLNGVLRTLGATTVGGVGVVLGGDPETIVPAEGRAYELGKRLAQAIANKETYPEQERFHAAMQERMQALVTANKDRWQHEYDYWQAAGRIP
ncbi:NAD(P)H-dependent oxidoreductase [Methanoculleus sp.]|uniref:flavodoxin family protein n=1 Tax=Methanoculleus sp. TaxID=90427 RepID=UPI00262D27B1|nr:NAD(P)H-dependent oxidoreductase [Methanoculleus sp.]MCK9298557.1 flavodoxin family protein [Methanoculleus sp.]MDD2253665.1 NAD(P)H-dependent oxidoreductase [Methanoculleus sp.]MDD2788719.1 NAD(P)H-dependent oxidoreductase [Methanoculleus sp.]MDD3216179.1 NAD(P)H-dependent oxidoreductase [Methanoculleus sp.]MDD4314152.1 NAD(P)H-dependent oxidoreductase [Methanoculleus sp.]